MFLVRDRKRVSVLVICGRQFDWLMNQMSEANRTPLVSRRQKTDGWCSKVRQRMIGRGLFTPFLGGPMSISSVWSETDRAPDVMKRHLHSMVGGLVNQFNEAIS